MRLFAVGLLATAVLVPNPAVAQSTVMLAQPITGTRLDITALGEVTRVPDVAMISAGVTTQAIIASEALSQNANRMQRVRSALTRAGIADRDIQTSSLSLTPQYKYGNNEPPTLTGYQASNQVSVRFRDIRSSGKILDALVAQGANQISGPTLTIDKPEGALDEARAKAVATGRARAELYARSLGLQVARVLSVSESGGEVSPPPRPMLAAKMQSQAETGVDAGEQQLQVSVAMSFELR